ncbi:unnamed protein product [Nezara viridula]|uniref:Uncharacterized protein n=1 Tax=Nezara viridula TaxID=85310 RepID=A0A9P0H520_NEZVI|nr:unnamed protein product [Nezara viridula]
MPFLAIRIKYTARVNFPKNKINKKGVSVEMELRETDNSSPRGASSQYPEQLLFVEQQFHLNRTSISLLLASLGR